LGPFTDEERYQFDLQGFLVRRGALSGSDVDAANRAIDAMALPSPGADIMSQRFTGHCAAPQLRALIDHPAVLHLVAELCGDTMRLDHTYGIHMRPGTSGLGLHGGSVPFDPAQYYVTDSAGIHCGLVAVQWSLGDAWPGQGGFACIPGSHRSAFALPRGVGLDHPMVREVPLRRGDMVIFTEALVHGTLPWTGTDDRRTVLYKYSPGNSSWTDNPALPPDVEAQLTPRQRLICSPPSVARKQRVL
jgi:ectoine hydroxylase-related dioxygenase (phytanoyl-CoA dioxygenase family)